MAISIDSMILIWGIKREATQNRSDMIPRATAFFKQCRDDHERIIIPAPSLAEYLVKLPAEQRAKSIALFEKSFIIAPLDAKAAAIAADLQYDMDALKSLAKEYSISRQMIKADVYVLACSIAAGATAIYSCDEHLVRMAKGKIIVRQLPEPSETQRLIYDVLNEKLIPANHNGKISIAAARLLPVVIGGQWNIRRPGCLIAPRRLK